MRIENILGVLQSSPVFMTISRGFYFTFLSAFTWAVTIVILRIILQSGENVYNVLFWTALLTLPYWLFTAFQSKDEIKKLTRKDYSILLWMAGISAVGVKLTEILALKYSPAINYAFLIRMVIIFTVIFAAIFLKEKITNKKIFLAVVLLVGAYLLTTSGKTLALTLGDTFTLIQAALIALGNNVLGKMATNRMSSNVSAAGSVILGFLPNVLIALAFTSLQLPVNFWLILLLSVGYIFLTQFRFTAYKHASASFVTMVFSFTPVFVALMAIPLLGETMTSVQILGGILIILAGVMVEKLKI
ncbi:MAG: hypothetical protein UY13_C0001G0040 [Candidatus Pacebacteria bacterium GW2011_GWB1_47_8]|nr:MAG: hypothetical protein UX28_C0003G0031 [Candidatus Pacebacteria bacterium GW2011_GWA1_46_10]KKU84718.1 MAG: hypothetical protein UY13_C0001G0040 [Candidatus Pacebacteria bacterium GW2011_GWB1_47_8]HCR81030.1 hypothetical protein [Candidatus Paceibacterota bacterium]